jgi:hypothetical protein
MGDGLEFTLEVVDPSAEPEEVEQASKGLRRELVEVDSVQVSPVTERAAPGAKGDLTLLGTMAVTMMSAAVPAVIALIGRWVNERGRCVVRIARPDGTTLEVSHTLQREEIERIVASLLPS